MFLFFSQRTRMTGGKDERVHCKQNIRYTRSDWSRVQTVYL